MTDSPKDPKNNIPSAVDNAPEISQHPALAGFAWIMQSFNLFLKRPSIWVVMLIIYFGLSLFLASLPVLLFLPALLSPIFGAGFIFGAKAVDNGEMLQIDHLFSGFKLQFRGLFRLGVLYFLLNFLIIAVVSIILGGIAEQTALAAMNQASTTKELEEVLILHPELLVALLKAMMIGVILSIPLIMASWFAPALVLLHQMPPLKAMLLSIKACNQNMMAFLFYGILMIPLLLLALLPLGLGLLIILPIIFISQYTSYKAIFKPKTPENKQGVFLV